MNDLGIVHYPLERKASAEKLLQECYDLRIQTLADIDPDVLESLHNRAILTASQNDLVECVVLREKVLGWRHLRTIESMFELAMSYARGSKATQEETVRLYENCLRKRRAMLGDNHPETLLALYCQAHVYDMLNRRH